MHSPSALVLALLFSCIVSPPLCRSQVFGDLRMHLKGNIYNSTKLNSMNLSVYLRYALIIRDVYFLIL